MDLKVSHYDVHTNDLEESKRFYLDILGFDLLFQTPPNDEAPLDLVWLRNKNGVVVELTREKSSYDAEALNRASQVHLAFCTDDLDGAVAHLKSKGIEFEVEPMEIALPFEEPLPKKHQDAFLGADGAAAKMRVSFFRGPSGERIELLEELA